MNLVIFIQTWPPCVFWWWFVLMREVDDEVVKSSRQNYSGVWFSERERVDAVNPES